MICKDEEGDCPVCGYPTEGQYLGVYFRGHPCDNCGYVDVIAAAKLVDEDLKSKARIRRNKKNPPIFKSVEDWKKWSENPKNQ
jgi:hypothetical protein